VCKTTCTLHTYNNHIFFVVVNEFVTTSALQMWFTLAILITCHDWYAAVFLSWRTVYDNDNALDNINSPTNENEIRITMVVLPIWV